MVPKSDFQALIRSIVKSCIPDEVDVLDFGGEELIEEVYRTGRAPVKEAAEAEFELVSGAVDILKMIPLALATYKTIKDFLRPSPKKQIVTQEIVQQEWSIILRAEGLPPALASEMAARFSQLVADLIAKYPLPTKE